MFQINKN